MINQILNKLMIAGIISAIGLSLIPITQAKADTDIDLLQKNTGKNVQFFCNQGYDQVEKRRLPTTYVWYQGEKRALIRWEKELGGKNPQERCELISPRFQEAYDNGTLSLITNGTMKGKPVICTAREYGGGCVTVLMTLGSSDNSLEILNDLKDALSGRSIGPIKQNGGVPQVYYQFDLEETLQNAPILH